MSSVKTSSVAAPGTAISLVLSRYPAATVTPPAASTKFDDIPKVPLYTKKGSDTQAYSDIGRGFRMLR